MLSSVLLDPATITAFVNDMLGRSANSKVRSIACARDGNQVRVNLNGVQTGLSVFGMAVPALDAELVIRGTTGSKGVVTMIWSIERVVGIPAMAAKLVGKPALAKMLRDALGTSWGIDRALTADDSGDLLLDPSLLNIPGCANLRIRGLALPGADGYVLKADFTWGK